MIDYDTITACGECCTGCKKKIDGICPGCIEADGRVPEWAESGVCKVHACCKEHHTKFCGLCEEFPCEKLPQMISWNPNIVEHLKSLAAQFQFEKTCGAVVFTVKNGGIKYLLVREKSGYWVFPKGHTEAGETEHETARREIFEETGLKVTFINGFQTGHQHTLAREGKPNTIKKNVFFLARYEDQDFEPQESEISEIALLDYDKAMQTIQLDSFRDILREANAFLKLTGEIKKI